MKTARLKFWGVRGSIPSPGEKTVFYGGNTPCIEVRVDDQIIVLDAGTGIRGLGLALNAEFGTRPIDISLLITHTHWDHIQGFPFFLPAYQQKNTVTIYGFEGARKGLQNTLFIQMDSPYFPVGLEQMPGRISIQELKSLQFKIGEVPVQAQPLNHPGMCTGYRIFTPTGSICYMPDTELFPRHLVEAGKKKLDDAELERVQQQDDALTCFLSEAEVVVMDSQYDAAEYSQHAGWGHTCVEDSVVLAVRAKVKRLFLFHHDPDHSDAQVSAILERAREIAAKMNSPIVIDAAREGLEVLL